MQVSFHFSFRQRMLSFQRLPWLCFNHSSHSTPSCKKRMLISGIPQSFHCQQNWLQLAMTPSPLLSPKGVEVRGDSFPHNHCCRALSMQKHLNCLSSVLLSPLCHHTMLWTHLMHQHVPSPWQGLQLSIFCNGFYLVPWNENSPGQESKGRDRRGLFWGFSCNFSVKRQKHLLSWCFHTNIT